MGETPEPIESALAALEERVRAMEGIPVAQGAPAALASPAAAAAAATTATTATAASEEFFRMDNPWMWIGFVAIAAAIFGLWYFLGKMKSSPPGKEREEEEEQDDPHIPQAGWPQQTTPRREYARHYGNMMPQS